MGSNVGSNPHRERRHTVVCGQICTSLLRPLDIAKTPRHTVPMPNTATVQTAREIAIEDMQIGVRYIDVIAGFESRWVVASVNRRTAAIEVLRGGEWVAPELVTVTYRNGQSITQEVGTIIAIDCIA